jgi:hypothetical protein
MKTNLDSQTARNVGKEDRVIELMEGMGQSVLLKAVVYGLPIVYAARLVEMVLSFEPARTVITQAIRDCSVVQLVFMAQRYMANYSARRSSLRDRRRDAWLIPFSSFIFLGLNLPLILGIPWPVGIAVLVPLCVVGYIVELRKIKRDLHPS